MPIGSKADGDTRNITYREWTTDADFATGATNGVASGSGSLTMVSARRHRELYRPVRLLYT